MTKISIAPGGSSLPHMKQLGGAAARCDVKTCLFVSCAIILGFVAVDLTPRFIIGDSESYLFTGNGWIPPDRSWLFGFFVNFLLRQTRGLTSLIVLQAAFLGVTIYSAREFFRDKPGWAYCLCGLFIAADPLIEMFLRFYMTDFLSANLFILYVAVMHKSAANDSTGRAGVSRGLAATLLCILIIMLRVAYLPILLGSGALLCLIALCNRQKKNAFVCAVSVAAPIAGACVLLLANAVLFSKLYPGEYFLNRLSSVGAMCIYAPALKMEDFEKANVHLTGEEFDRLDLADFHRRNPHIFWTGPEYLHSLLGDKVAAGQGMGSLSATESAITRNAFLRDPLPFVKIAVRVCKQYLSPGAWKRMRSNELGTNRVLSPNGVRLINTYSNMKVTDDITQTQSVVFRYYSATCGMYPYLILCVAGCAVMLLIGGRHDVAAAILPSSVLSILVFTPVYSLQVTPRYIIPLFLLGYIMLPIVASRLAARKNGAHG